MKYIIVSLGLMVASFSFAQCGTDYYNEHLFKSEKMLELGKDYMDKISNGGVDYKTTSSGLIIIPVVVHVNHDGGIGNIPLEQVESGLQMLNEDFRRLNADSTETREVFLPVVGRAGFEFRLAQIDPDGNPTTGIVRVDTPLSYDANDDIKYVSYWPADRYFNFWIVNTIENFTGSGGTILGYAQFPQWGINQNYGIVIRHDTWGRIGTSGGGRTLTHEMGHCLGLYHTFQGGCASSCGTSGDQCCDTPPAQDDTQGCDDQLNSCSNDNVGGSPFGGDVVNQIENYMSYDDCQNMFSENQVERMWNSVWTVGGLTNLVSEDNLSAAGVDQLMFADFFTNTQIVCQGEQARFYDISRYGANGWEWNFEAGDPLYSDEELPLITYNTPGTYAVNLSAEQGVDVLDKNKANYIFVVGEDGVQTPYSENFDNTASIPNDQWFVLNEYDDAATWTTTNNGYGNSVGIVMNNFINDSTSTEEFISNTLDLSVLNNVTISFKLAYGQKLASDNDNLTLSISRDCGATWSARWSMSGGQLATVGPSTISFVPTDTNDWVDHTVTNITSSYLVEDFLFKFTFRSDQGNNLYLDNINVDGNYSSTVVLNTPENFDLIEAVDTLLDWKSLDGVDGYEYEFDTTTDFNSPDLVTGQTTYIDLSPYNADTEIAITNLQHSTTYYWRVQGIEAGIGTGWSDIWQFTTADYTNSVVQEVSKEIQCSVFPNPSNGNTNLNILLEKDQMITIEVRNTLGELLSTEYHKLNKGIHLLQLESTDIPGIYLVHIRVGDKVVCKRLIIE